MNYVYASLPFGFEGGMREMIVLSPCHCISIYFVKCSLYIVVVVLFNVRGKQLRSCRDGQLTNI